MTIGNWKLWHERPNEKIPLSAIISNLEADKNFNTEVSRTGTVSSLLWHWLVKKELRCYECGRIVEDVCAIKVLDHDIERGISAIEDFWQIDLKHLVEVIQSKGFTVPECCKA